MPAETARHGPNIASIPLIGIGEHYRARLRPQEPLASESLIKTQCSKHGGQDEERVDLLDGDVGH
jgi:hypothetical protein